MMPFPELRCTFSASKNTVLTTAQLDAGGRGGLAGHFTKNSLVADRATQARTRSRLSRRLRAIRPARAAAGWRVAVERPSGARYQRQARKPELRPGGGTVG